MKRTIACLVLLIGVPAAQAATDSQDFGAIEHGRYLATVGDCVSCHTAPGGKAYAGGRPIETPFGNLISSNLTPDRETGIGAWSDDAFVQAVRNGIGPGGYHLYPAMPYPYYTKISRQDALDIRAYLATLEPVNNAVTANQLPFPFDIRLGMAAWNALYFDPGQFKPVAGKSEAWNRGAYLVEGLGHCGACHTEKNVLGGDETSHALEGGVVQRWFSPDLTGDPREGLSNWSADDIVAYLETGHNRFAAATGPMAEVITNSTSQMSRRDLLAIADLSEGPARGERFAARPPSRPTIPRCARARSATPPIAAACHAGDGGGRRAHVPDPQGQRDRAVGRSHQPDPRRPGGRAERRDRSGADRVRHAGVRLEAVRHGDRGRADLYPEQLGQRGARRLRGRREEAAPAACERAIARSRPDVAAARSRRIYRLERRKPSTVSGPAPPAHSASSPAMHSRSVS